MAAKRPAVGIDHLTVVPAAPTPTGDEQADAEDARGDDARADTARDEE